MITVNICDALEIDAEEILEVQKLAFYRQGILYNDLSLPPLVQTLEELVRDFKTYSFLKAINGSRIVGSVRAVVEGDTCFISRLIVHPDYQNRGIGKKLMFDIENRFSGARRYELNTGHKSVKNLVLYDKLGYRKFQEKLQGEHVALVCLEKRRI